MNALPEIVGFLRFPPTGKVDSVDYRLGSSPSLKGLKIAVHASGQKGLENMRGK